MVFDVQQYRQFVELIYKHPEWRAELRQLVLTEELLALPDLVRELAEAQKRSEERLTRLEATVAELAEAQKRSEERLTRLEATVAELAEAQKRTEQRVEELAEAQKRTELRVEELAEAQKRTELRVEELAEAQKRTEQRVGNLESAMAELAAAHKQIASHLARLDNRIGISVEREAADALAYTLREKGYQILDGPFNVPVDGEVDILYQVVDAAGNRLTAVMESKFRLSYGAVEDWAKQMRSIEFRQKLAQAGFPGPYLVYIYGMGIHPSARDAIKRFGIGLITDRGDWIDPVEILS